MMGMAEGNPLILIALSGGTPAERIEISDRLVASGKRQLVAFALDTPGAEHSHRRWEILNDALEGLTAACRTPAIAGGLVVTHCLSAREADEVRRRGGAIWHLHSKPSKTVPILLGDPIVVASEDGFRHVRSAMEALSEMMLLRLAQDAPGTELTRSALSTLTTG